MPNYDFLLELRLKKLDRDLAVRHAGCTSLFEQMLKKFIAVFPHFTDHTLLHTLNITNISNQLLRSEVEKLNADEIYVYLMTLALHDIGMGISDKDLDPFIDALGLRDYVDSHPEQSKAAFIRDFHQDLSAEFVKKYWQILEVPSERYAYAIAETARGHRKTDLMDTSQYPVSYDLGNGKQVNLALLAALVRLADELDVAADRNPELLYNEESMVHMTRAELFEFDKHKAIHAVDFTEDAIVISAAADSDTLKEGLFQVIGKVKETVDYCCAVIHARSDVRLSATRICFVLNQQELPVG